MTPEGDLPYVSIIVPAHNEERYIGETLAALAAQTYPHDRFEAIVIENGSTDDTRAKAEAFARGNLRVLSLKTPGVSHARNAGIDAARTDADWLLFLDADTLLAPGCLADIVARLTALPPRAVVGTAKVAPHPPTPAARAWFAFFNGAHKALSLCFAICLARRRAVGDTRYDEQASWMEDAQFVRELRRRGSFFFLKVDGVATSTRRHTREGWWWHLLWNAFVGALPPALQRGFKYAPVR